MYTAVRNSTVIYCYLNFNSNFDQLFRCCKGGEDRRIDPSGNGLETRDMKDIESKMRRSKMKGEFV